MTDLLDCHALKRDVPRLPGARVATCSACARWFVAPPRYRRCHECQPTTNARERLASAVAALERASVPAAKPKDQANVGGLSLGRAMAMVAALRIDVPNLRACDLKPEFRDLWPA
jgi:hypothetical protein